MKVVRLSDILHWLGVDGEYPHLIIDGVSEDSRHIRSGYLFLALKGLSVHGMHYAYQAQKSGACAILSEADVSDRAGVLEKYRKEIDIPVIEVQNLGQRVGLIADRFYCRPSGKMHVTAVTGTNGKTSVCWLLYQAHRILNTHSAYIGTLGAKSSVGFSVELNNTTPPALQLHYLLYQFASSGIRSVCIEASSHGLDQHRLHNASIDVGVFTNLTRDHLDYHQTEEAYQLAKEKLFSDFSLSAAIVNQDDPFGKVLKEKYSPVLTYSVTGKNADIRASKVRFLSSGTCFVCEYKDFQRELTTQLIGAFNVSNLLAVIGALIEFGYSFETIVAIIPKLKSVPGRMEVLKDDNSPLIVIDYAHTPDALDHALMTLAEYKESKLWCVFGCGGDRDKGKRSQMGAVAEYWADHIILTDDNPRGEDGEAIVVDIQKGMQKSCVVVRDRKKAIEYTLSRAGIKDVVLIAGKGHESTQETREGKVHFNDIEVCQKYLGGCL